MKEKITLNTEGFSYHEPAQFINTFSDTLEHDQTQRNTDDGVKHRE